MKTARIEILFDSDNVADIVVGSIEPEIKKRIPKTDIEMFYRDKKLVIIFNSKDTSSLRAACNSYLRWIETALSVVEIV